VLLAALAAPAYAAANRPFKADIAVQEQLGRSTDCLGDQGQPGLQGHFSGSGQATHLGAVHILSVHCVTPRQDLSSFINRGVMTIEGANGDQVFAEYSGFITRSDAGVFTFEGTYFITGGTGRFVDASGMGALLWTVEGDFFTQVHGVSLTADGRISY
jgi:hypothetical protein